MEDIHLFDWSTVELFLQKDIRTNRLSNHLIRSFNGRISDQEILRKLIGSICRLGSQTMKTALLPALFVANRNTRHTGNADCACVDSLGLLREVFQLGFDPMIYLNASSTWRGQSVSIRSEWFAQHLHKGC